MNILERNQTITIDTTSRVGDLYNKFEEYQQKRGNTEEAFSMLRWYIMDEKQLGDYPLYDDGNIIIFLKRIKLQWDELVVILDYSIKSTNNLFKTEDQKKLVEEILVSIKRENKVRLNIEEIDNYRKSIMQDINFIIEANNNGFTISKENELTISKDLYSLDSDNPQYTIYLESLIFRLEDNEELSQEIKRVYKNKEWAYIIVLSNRVEIKLELIKDEDSLDSALVISTLLENIEIIWKYEKITQQYIINKFKQIFEKQLKKSPKLTTKQKLFTILSFGFYKPKLGDKEEKIDRNEMDELEYSVIAIREIEMFYKKNMIWNSLEILIDMRIYKFGVLEYAGMALDNIRYKVYNFLDEGKSISKISITQELIQYWKDIMEWNISRVASYIIKNKLLKWARLQYFLAILKEFDDLDIEEITTEKVYLDSIVQPSENLPYSLMIWTEKMYIHSPNNWIFVYNKDTKEQEMIIIPGNTATFSPNMRYALLVEEWKDFKESYSIYDMEKRKTINEFRVKGQGYFMHENIMTNNYFLQVSRDEFFIKPLDWDIVQLWGLKIDKYAISQDINNDFIFYNKKREISYYNTQTEEFNKLYTIPNKSVVIDIICTKQGLNVFYVDMEKNQVVMQFNKIIDGTIDLSSEIYRFKGDIQPIQNRIKISSDNKYLLVIQTEWQTSNIQLFDIEFPSIVQVATIANMDKSIDDIMFSSQNEITYVVDNNVYIVDVDSLRILSKNSKDGKKTTKRKIPNYGRIPGTTIWMTIDKPRSKSTTNPFLRSNIDKRKKSKKSRRVTGIVGGGIIHKISSSIWDDDAFSMEKKLSELERTPSKLWLSNNRNLDWYSENIDALIKRKHKKVFKRMADLQIKKDQKLEKMRKKLNKKLDKKKFNF